MKKVAVIVQDQAHMFGLGAICEVWNEPFHPEDGNPTFEFTVCSPTPGRLSGSGGFDLHIPHDLSATEDADLVCVAPKDNFEVNAPEAIDAVRRAADRGAYVSAHCSGVWMLGQAGLLDGRECTTHWRHGDRLQEQFPEASVRPDMLYVLDGNILTGAGSAAGIDASLHLMRTEFGARTAATAARRIVMPPHRDGGQAQFVRTPMATTEAESLAPLLAWALEHLDESLSVDLLARQAHMSPRTFARRFRDETGTTPLKWLVMQRVSLAAELLESSTMPIEQIAARVGFGNAATLRHHFSAILSTTPQAYRRTFCSLDAAS